MLIYHRLADDQKKGRPDKGAAKAFSLAKVYMQQHKCIVKQNSFRIFSFKAGAKYSLVSNFRDNPYRHSRKITANQYRNSV